MKLPGWVVSNKESVEREVERFRSIPDDQRGALIHAVCQMAATVVAGREDDLERRKLLAYQDPLPESSRRVLEKLRARARQHP